MSFSEKYVNMLLQHPLFSGTDREKLSRMLSGQECNIKTVPAGEEIFSPQSEQKAIWMILSGKAIVTTPDREKSVLMRYLTTGELFGIANLFTKTPYVSIVRASSACKVLCLSEKCVRELLETDHEFLYRYLEFLSGRICFLNRKIGYLTAGSAERRLALYLTSLKSNPVTLPLSISSLSELLDVGRASLYRAFDRLTADGFIKKDGRMFYLSDPDAMLHAYH